MNKLIKLDIKALQKFAKDLYQDAKQIIKIYLFSENVAPLKEEHSTELEVFEDQDSTVRALVGYLYPIIKFGLLTILLFIEWIASVCGVIHTALTQPRNKQNRR